MAQSLDRGLRILDEIAAGRTTLGEISTSLGVHKSTVLRLLATLQQHHFVYREDASNYRLGRRLFSLASFALDSRQLIAQARDIMRRLGQSSGHASYLASLEGGELVVVGVASGRRALHPVVGVGDALSIHATAAGKVLLSDLAVSARDDLLGEPPLEACTERTITDAGDLNTQASRAASLGYAMELGEFLPHVNALAAPVRDSSGAIVASLALTVPSVSFSEAELTAFVPELLAAATEISSNLGWD